MTRPAGPTAIWALLMLATLAGVGGAGVAGWQFGLVMLAATVKAYLIVHHYMELRVAPFAWRLVFDVLVVFSGMMIWGAHILA
ncbi:MAG: cytochrome C oxidase subunit IV family protein [Sphingobium sp.]